MKIQTLSVVAGTKSCDAHCPFCVSKMTGLESLPDATDINERNLHKCLKMASRHEAESILITGKGEPTLYPEQISKYMEIFQLCDIPIIEIQTNGIQVGRLHQGKKSTLDFSTLKKWHHQGLDVFAISVVHYLDEYNKRVYNQDYPNLKKTIDLLREVGFGVRLCVMMQKHMIDYPSNLFDVIDFCKELDVFQLTVRSIRKPENSHLASASDYVHENGLSENEILNISRALKENGTLVRTLVHGAEVFDVHGQNVCLSDCLTVEGEKSDIRTLIFYPDGKISYDWQYDGARIL